MPNQKCTVPMALKFGFIVYPPIKIGGYKIGQSYGFLLRCATSVNKTYFKDCIGQPHLVVLLFEALLVTDYGFFG
jgi:hypothetical protein